MSAIRKTDHAGVLGCLRDDVEWLLPGGFHARGKEAFDREIENEDFTGSPDIRVSRLTEENDVVIAEGTVRAQRRDGTPRHLAFCDVFEMRGGKIGRLTSYLMETPPNGAGG